MKTPFRLLTFKRACHRTTACRTTRRERRVPEAERSANKRTGGFCVIMQGVKVDREARALHRRVRPVS